MNVERRSDEKSEGRITGARAGLLFVWADSIGADHGAKRIDSALRAHRSLIFGSAEYVRGFTGAWQMERGRKHPPKVNAMRGDWGGLAVIQWLRRQVFG